MIKEFIVYRDTLIEALNHLDEFKTKMDTFIEKNPHYSYDEELKEHGQAWEITIKVKKNEQANVETT